MSAEHSEQLETGMSTGIGILKAVLIAALPAGFFYYLLYTVFSTMPERWGSLLTCIVWGLAAGYLYLIMVKNTGNVRPGYVGVHTALGGITGIIYAVGEHPLLPGVEDVIEVNTQDQPVDPPVFEELAKDKVPVFLDGYALVNITDPITFLTTVDADKAIDILMKLLDAEMRLFVAQWKTAIALITQRELLTRFLKLSGPHDADYGALEADLMELTVGDNAPLDELSVRNIMEDAGKFCQSAARWGYSVSDIHMERVDLPDRIKQASTEAAAARDAMTPFKIKKDAMAEMVNDMKERFPSIPERDIFLTMQQLVGIPVNRNVSEIEFRGLSIPQELARSAASFIQKLGGIPQKGE